MFIMRLIFHRNVFVRPEHITTKIRIILSLNELIRSL